MAMGIGSTSLIVGAYIYTKLRHKPTHTTLSEHITDVALATANSVGQNIIKLAASNLNASVVVEDTPLPFISTVDTPKFVALVALFLYILKRVFRILSYLIRKKLMKS